MNWWIKINFSNYELMNQNKLFNSFQIMNWWSKIKFQIMNWWIKINFSILFKLWIDESGPKWGSSPLRSLQSDTITFFTKCNNLPRPDCNFAKIASVAPKVQLIAPKFNYLRQNSADYYTTRELRNMQLVHSRVIRFRRVKWLLFMHHCLCIFRIYTLRICVFISMYLCVCTCVFVSGAFQSDPVQEGQLLTGSIQFIQLIRKVTRNVSMFQMFHYAKWIPSDHFLQWFDSSWINLVQEFAKCLEIPPNSPNIPWKSWKHIWDFRPE